MFLINDLQFCLKNQISFSYRAIVLLVFVGTFLSSSLAAQKTIEISANPAEFKTQINALFENTQSEKTKDILKEFNKNIDKGALDEEKIAQLAALFNVMFSKKMTASPYIDGYMAAANKLLLIDTEGTRFKGWIEVSTQFANLMERGKNARYDAFIDFSNSFFERKVLFDSPAKSWGIKTDDFMMAWKDNDITITAPKTTFFGATQKKDTITIQETAGTFYLLGKKWIGKGGKITWERTKSLYKDAYCDLQDYEINLENPEFTIENVTLHLDKYLPQPQKGRITDKIVVVIKDDYEYPQFESYNHDLSIKTLADNVHFFGGFGLRGAKATILGTKEQKASMQFFSSKGNVVLKAHARFVGIRNNEEINSTETETALYFAQDSIYHPSLTLNYKIPTKHLRLVRDEKATSQIAFMDSYHKVEMKTDALDWKLDEPKITFQKISTLEGKPVFIESYNYYNKNRVEKYLALTEQNMVAILKNWLVGGSNQMPALDFARSINSNYNVQSALTVIYDLVADGFIYYDSVAEMITIREKARDYALSYQKEKDYDNIQFVSVYDKDNIELNLDNYELNLRGVKQVMLSDTQKVVLFPYNKEFFVKKERDTDIYGDVVAGRMDLIGGNFKFNYGDFNINVDSTQKLLFYIPTKDQIDNPKELKTEPIKTFIHNVSGTMEIDNPDNKSGLVNNEQYPRFESKKNAFVYYDDKELFNGAYARDRFFFKLDPFTVEDVDRISPEKLSFGGMMVFGDIFPEVRKTIDIQEDKSFGFKDGEVHENTPLYKNIGKFTGTVMMNLRGLRGDGSVFFEPATLKVRDCLFLPDSMLVDADEVLIEKGKFHGVSYPKVTNGLHKVRFFPYKDSLNLIMKELPFAMFEDRAQMKGNLLMQRSGLKGRGHFLWQNALVKSQLFTFDEATAYSDTADLEIKIAEGSDKVWAQAKKLKTTLQMYDDFANFKRQTDTLGIKMPVIRYMAYSDEVDWKVKQNVLTFKNKGDQLAKYYSLNKKQDSLRFDAKLAEYELDKDLVHFSGVPDIKIADASIIPPDNRFDIGADAAMQTMQGARIEVDTLSKIHNISNADVEIFGRFNYRASGDYVYQSPSLSDQIIRLNSITTQFIKNEKQERRKDKTLIKDGWYTFAETDVPEEQNFHLDERMLFKGKVALASQNKFMTFDGFSKIELRTQKLSARWFAFKDEVNPKNIQIALDTLLKGEEKEPLFTGLMFSFGDNMPYSVFMDSKRGGDDYALTPANGLLAYNAKQKTYQVGDAAKLRQEKIIGNVFTLYDEQDKVNVEGKINFCRNLGLVKADAAGIIENDLNTNSFLFKNIALGLNMHFDGKIWDAIATDVRELVSDNKEVNFMTQGFNKAVVELVKPEIAEVTLINLSKDGYFNKPKDFDYPLFFADLTMVWDSLNNSFRSVGNFGVAYIGNTYINRTVKNSYIEFAPRKNGDFFNIYIEMEDPEKGVPQWYYFHYSANTFQVLSSKAEINTMIEGIKESKRIKEDKEKAIKYQYAVAPVVKKNNFVFRLQENRSWYEALEKVVNGEEDKK